MWFFFLFPSLFNGYALSLWSFHLPLALASVNVFCGAADFKPFFLALRSFLVGREKPEEVVVRNR